MARNLGQPFNRTLQNREQELAELERRLAQEALAQQSPIQEMESKIESIMDQINNHQNQKNYFVIPSLFYYDGIYTVELSRSLLDNGNKKTQEGWAEFRKLAEPRGEFYTADMPLYHEIFTKFSESKDKYAKEAIEFIREQIRRKYPMTLTKIICAPSGYDRVIHNTGTKNEYFISKKMIGSEGMMPNITNPEALNALIGTANMQEIMQTYQAINGTPTYLLRRGLSSDRVMGCVGGFIADQGGVYIDFTRNPSDTGVSFGVRAHCLYKIPGGTK